MKTWMWMVAGWMALAALGCTSGTTGEAEQGATDTQGDNVDGDTDKSASSDADTDAGNLHAPMLADPALLPVVFGAAQTSTNLDFGQSVSFALTANETYRAFTFDALPGARAIATLTGFAPSDGGFALYGPRGANGLWGSALATARTQNGIALLGPYELPASGSYLLLVIHQSAVDANLTLTLGALGRGDEPACPDLTCQIYCAGGFVKDDNGCDTCSCAAATPGSDSEGEAGGDGDADNGASGCVADADCPSGQVCASGACVSASPCQCSGDYAPVCGGDGVQYANDCLRRCAGVTIGSSCFGACSFDSDCAASQRCVNGACAAATDCTCDPTYSPVCGTDQRTYGNRCEALCAGVSVLQDGVCANAPGADGDTAADTESGAVDGDADYSSEPENVDGDSDSPTVGCTADSDCGSGYACVASICTSNSDALSCVVSGRYGEHCASSRYPSSGTYQASYTCLRYASCVAVNQSCVFASAETSGRYDQCLQSVASGTFCRSDSDCGAETWCIENLCLPANPQCPSDSVPVCGGDGHTYRNPCDALASVTTIASFGACP